MARELAKAPDRIFYAALRPLPALFQQESRRLAVSETELSYPPIFIVGSPRSGTTLLYQLMVHCFRLAYFPRVVNKLYTSPILATGWALKRHKPYISDFTSSYGLIDDPMSPHEAGAIWNRWYPIEQVHGYNYTPAGYFDDTTRHVIYQTIAGVERLFDAPFINKNVKHSVRIQSLVEIFPQALFLQVKRDPFDTASSILKMRKANLEDPNEWLSAMPKQIDQLKDKSYLEQVCGQVFFLERNMEEDTAMVGL